MKNFKLTPSCFRVITPKIKNNEKYISNVDKIKYLNGKPLNKYWTFDFIETISDYINFDEIKTIIDIGSRDGYQSLEFRNWFPDSNIILFEANPNQIQECINVTKNHNITVIPKAVGDFNGKTKFYICSGNVGGSSLLKVNNHPRSRQWFQSEIEVDITRLDKWCSDNKITDVDLLWVDVQGAEKMVFNGCGKILDNVKAICTEVELSHMYHNSTLKDELDFMLENRGFVEVQTYHMGDKIKSVEDLVENIAECDVIYINKKYIK